MSKLGTSGSLKECERDAARGDEAAALEETTLPLLFRAARWERTFTKTTRDIGEEGSVRMQARSSTDRQTDGQAVGVFRGVSDWSHSGLGSGPCGTPPVKFESFYTPDVSLTNTATCSDMYPFST